MTSADTASRVPVLVLGGSANALSVARSLGRRGIPVRVSAPPGSPQLDSRYCAERLVSSKREGIQDHWLELLTLRGEEFAGSLLLACDDDAVSFLATHRAELEDDYLLDDAVPSTHLAMLDKKKTLELAKSAGIDIPGYWEVERIEDVDAIFDSISFPIIIKPIHSHLFQRHFSGGDRKFLEAHDGDELRTHLKTVFDLGLRVMLVEKIPGPDSLLGSYYTYIDADGRALFHYTKKIVRRYPMNEGGASFHRTEWDEEIAEAGQRFFEGVAYRGFGNVEFKRDERDGKLKIIECNPRFTAAQELLVRSGLDTAVIVYNHVTGEPLPAIDRCREDIRYWYPVRDFRAYLQLRKRNELSFAGWLASVYHRHCFPFFRFDDPKPSVARCFRKIVSLGG